MNIRKLAVKLFLMATTALVGAELAHADDFAKKKKHFGPRLSLSHVAPQEQAFSWTGFHIGIGGGGSFMRSGSFAHSHVSQRAANSNYANYFETYTNDQTINQTLQGTGAFGTVAAGYDRRSGNVVLGGFGDLSFGGASLSTSTTDSSTTSVVTDSFANTLATFGATSTLSQQVGMSNEATIGARIGYLANERTLFYALGGFSLANLDVRSMLNVTHDQGAGSALSNFSLGTSYDGWKPGFAVGAGVEFALTDKLSLQAEYRYSNYGNVQSSNSVTLVDGSASISQNVDISTHTVRAVLNYHF